MPRPLPVRLLQHTLIALAFWIRAGSIAHAELIRVASVIDGDTTFARPIYAIHLAVQPQSTSRSAPVTNDASPESRK
jgi:hypothetical protein